MDQKKRVGVVADDITGANDIGVMFAKNGYATAVIPYDSNPGPEMFQGLDVVILDTDSRLDTPETARQKVFGATKLLMETGFDWYHNKTCSVFRGNIGAEFDAMQDALGQSCSMVVLGFPKLGRTTKEGIHYVNGISLEESSFLNDPIHPTTEPDLCKIIQKQSTRSCACFTWRELELPEQERKERLEAFKRDNAYVIFDVRDQSDLRQVAELLKDERNICGSSAIGEELPAAWGRVDPDDTLVLAHPIADSCGTLVLAGSLTVQTREQVAYLKTQGMDFASIDPMRLFAEEKEALLEELIRRGAETVSAGREFLIHTANQPEEVAAAKGAARARGLTDEETGRLVSAAVSRAAREIQARTGCKKLVVAGGDTSAAVSRAFGLDKMVILREIEPGVPTMYGYGNAGELMLVFKSGSFGSESFLKKSVEKLKNLQLGIL